MADFDGCYRAGPRPYTIEEVPSVALTMVSGGAGEMYLIGADSLLEELLGLGLEAAAGNVHPSFGAGEAHALADMVVARYPHF